MTGHSVTIRGEDGRITKVELDGVDLIVAVGGLKLWLDDRNPRLELEVIVGDLDLHLDEVTLEKLKAQIFDLDVEAALAEGGDDEG